MRESVGVLFVCMGNICRSPTAEGVFRDLLASSAIADRVRVDSAGTHDYHPGKSPDPRSSRAAARRGYDLTRLRARVVRRSDFEQFDYVLAMDRGNYHDLTRICPPDRDERLRMFLSFAPEFGVEEVPDPYFGGASGFEGVLDIVEAGAAGLLAHLTERLQ